MDQKIALDIMCGKWWFSQALNLDIKVLREHHLEKLEHLIMEISKILK